MMEVVYPRCAGLDVHKRSVTACVRVAGPAGRPRTETRTFGTMTADLEALAAWLATHGCTHVALESTGVYWRPVYNVLEGAVEVVLANARHVKAVPGRKTDVRDAEWLAELLAHGLIRGSFIPPAPIRELRELTRARTGLVEDRARVANRIQKLLEGGNIKLAAVATDILGASGRRMLAALAAGEADPAALAELAHGRLPEKRPALARALHGRLLPHQRRLLRQALEQVEALDGAIAELDGMIAERTRPFEAEVALLDPIPGVGPRVAQAVLAEIGADMARFPSARHLASWAALCPGNRESGGKRLSGQTRHGNRFLRAALLQAAWAAVRVKGSYFGAQFRRLLRRRGIKRALLAVAHSPLVVIYHVLRDRTPYRDLGADYFDRRDPATLARYHTRRLMELGFSVTAVPSDAA